MKKTSLFLAISAIIPLLTGCNSSPVKITYGSLIEVTEYTASSLYLLSSGDLLSKLESNETFLLAITTSSSCTCWSNTCASISKVSNKHHLRFYTFVGHTTQDIEKYNVSAASDPAIYLISKGRVKLRLSTSNNEKIVYDSEKLYEEISKISISPSLMFIDEQYLLNHFIEGQDSGVVSYIKKDCPDCTYCLPNVLLPYFEENTSKNDFIYIFDIQYLAKEEDYFQKKQKYHLADTLPDGSNNPFGYDTGFVPTTQYWSKGKLESMSVYFNDSLKEKDGDYIINKTYYTKDRLPLLNYLDDIEVKVLQDLKIDAADTINGHWQNVKAAKYHDPILKAFLNKYIK